MLSSISNAESKSGDDLMYAIKSYNATYTAHESVQLDFQRLLSKLTVKAYATNAASDVKIKNLTLYTPKGDATATVSLSDVGVAWQYTTDFVSVTDATDKTALSASYQDYKVVTTTGEAQPVKTDDDVDLTTLPALGSAFVVPTAVADATSPTASDMQLYMDLTYNYDGTDFTKECMAIEGLHQFRRGTHHTLNICVKAPGILAYEVGTVSDWNTDGTSGGDSGQTTDPTDPTTPATPTTGEANGHAYVDLGLPTKTLWATMNVGAESETDYGIYVQWGETAAKTGYIDGGEVAYDTSTYPEALSGKYTTENETLELDDDVAHAQWQGSWRIPTKEEYEELVANTTQTWVTTYGGKDVAGQVYKSSINGNEIFLPAAGFITGSTKQGTSIYAYYWTATTHKTANNAWIARGSAGRFNYGSVVRTSGYPVRPVMK